MKPLRFLLFLFIIIGAVAGAYLLYAQLSSPNIRIVENGYVFNASYSNNIWNYSISGELPNPCYTYYVNENINSNTADITFVVNKPGGETICTEVVEPITYTSTLNYSKDAKFNFKVVDGNNDSINNNYLDNLNENLFTIEKEYIDETGWAYAVNGTLPPCYSVVNSEQEILESYPEQIYIVLTIKKPEKSCSEDSPFEYNDSGMVQASPDATFRVKLNNIL
ncbi:hypothetical protein KC678_04250 [Candidatus Dojkabacteria bacterium]|uniref:Uncharacterized protein n=1 Tax=Candidatus Dojkabacteria bacterium TaxID=2099670 RepID=A0A955RHH5_9BACT|nr:hypothetical protein [Candidatus Dojkabacteria bacterium]